MTERSMRILNVIVTKNGIVDQVESFGVFDEQDPDTVVEQAEKLFTEKIVGIKLEDTQSEEADNLRDEIAENWIDEGCYEVGDGDSSAVHLVWSDIQFG